MHSLLHNTGFYPCEELSCHSLTLYLTGYIPSGQCPARSRRTPHSWRGRARTETQRRLRALGVWGYGCPEEEADGGASTQARRGTRENGSGGRDYTQLWIGEPAVTSDGKRRTGRGPGRGEKGRSEERRKVEPGGPERGKEGKGWRRLARVCRRAGEPPPGTRPGARVAAAARSLLSRL